MISKAKVNELVNPTKTMSPLIILSLETKEMNKKIINPITRIVPVKVKEKERVNSLKLVKGAMTEKPNELK